MIVMDKTTTTVTITEKETERTGQTMRILVTGSGGFLGHHVMSRLKGMITAEPATIANYSFTLLAPRSTQLDLTSLEKTLEYFQTNKPERVLHMAAVCGGIQANRNRPADFVHLNARMALNIFEAARQTGTEYVYSLGTVCAYPKHCPVPFREEEIWNGYPEETNAPYGTAKRLTMVLQQAYKDQYNIKGVHFIPVNMYGEHDHFDLENSHVIPALIRKFSEATQQGSDVVYGWGTGTATREFLYAGDCATALVNAVLEGRDLDVPVNLGTGVSISISELAQLIATMVGYRGKIIFTGEVSDGQPARQLDVSRAKNLLGFTAMTDLKNGLKQTIDWYMQNGFGR